MPTSAIPIHVVKYSYENFCSKIFKSKIFPTFYAVRQYFYIKRSKLQYITGSDEEREIPGSVRTADGTTDTSAVAQGRAREPKKDMTRSWLTDSTESDKKDNQTNGE